MRICKGCEKQFEKTRSKSCVNYCSDSCQAAKWARDNLERHKASQRQWHSKRSKFLKLRFQILIRDRFMCQYCGRKAPEVVLHVDHVIPISKHGRTIESNLVTSCRDCNLGKSNQLINI